MNADARTRAFEPAFTARAAELGLHTVLGIVRRAGGRVAIDSEVNTGHDGPCAAADLHRSDISQTEDPSCVF